MKRRTPKQIEDKIDKVYDKVNKKIRDSIDRSSKFSAGLANEGYLGGYAQALSDVSLFIRCIDPNTNDFWREEE